MISMKILLIIMSIDKKNLILKIHRSLKKIEEIQIVFFHLLRRVLNNQGAY